MHELEKKKQEEEIKWLETEMWEEDDKEKKKKLELDIKEKEIEKVK